MTANPPADAPGLSDRARWRAFAVCLVVAGLTVLDISKLNVGLPSIEQSVHANSSQLQFLLAGYALAYGLALVPSGRLGDIHSRKRLFVIGLAMFVVTSALCAVAPSIEFLLVVRVLQGLSAGVQMPQVIGLIQQLFQGASRSRALGLLGATIGVSSALAPSLGGLLILAGGPVYGWRLVFLVNVPLGIAALVAAVRLLPTRQRTERKHTELDLVGIVLLGLAVLGLMLPFVLTTGGPTDDPRRWFFLVAFAIFLVAFILWERAYARAGKSPAVHFSLFALTSFRNGLVITLVYYTGIPVGFLLVTLFAQQGLGLVPVLAGLITLPFAVTQSATAYLASSRIYRYGRSLMVIGTVILLVGTALLVGVVSFAPADLIPYGMGAALLLGGVGGGLIASPNQAITLSDMPVAQAGVGGSMAQLSQRIGTSIGFAAVSSVFFSTIYREHGVAGDIGIYRDGFRNGFSVILVLFLVVLVLGMLDLFGRQRRNLRGAPA